MRLTEVLPTDPPTAALLDAYFAERVEGFATSGGYRIVHPDPTAFAPPDGVFLRLDAEDGAVGCGGLRRVPPGPLGDRLEVKHLFVLPSARGTGGGRLLLDGLIARARRRGAAEVVLDTNRSLTEAAALYRRSGFVAIPPYNDNPNATDWLGLRLG